jgi:hypothetical protein
LIIGLSGYARSGKDEAAKVLVEQFGFERIAFADKLRDFLYALNPIVDINVVVHPFDDENGKLRLGYEPQNVRLKEVIDRNGWDGYKETRYGAEIRGLLQRLGTEAGRNVLWDSIWIDAAFHGLDPAGNYVVTDCRFPNEAEAVRSRNGAVVRITRSGVGPANGHASETSLDDYEFDYRIDNSGTLEEYHELIGNFYDGFLRDNGRR